MMIDRRISYYYDYYDHYYEYYDYYYDYYNHYYEYYYSFKINVSLLIILIIIIEIYSMNKISEYFIISLFSNHLDIVIIYLSTIIIIINY